MKNINITIFDGDEILHEYLSDIIPEIGDSIEIPEEYQKHKSNGIYEIIKIKNSGIYDVKKRVFVAHTNKVKIHI